MEKLVYVLWKREDERPGAFKRGLLGEVSRRLRGLGVRQLACNVVDEFAAQVQSARISRLDPPVAGTVSFWLDAADDRGPCEEALAAVASRAEGYLVVESVPLVNTTRTAPLGERTPGINMVALIERPAWIGWERWLDRWLGAHRAVALETQCTFRYVRNVVVRRLTRDAPAWAGIVEEGFPTDAVTNPMLWYRAGSSAETMHANIVRMVESCKAFLDLDRVESHPMSEYRISD